MFVIKKMQLNKYEARPIVSNRELFVAQGERPSTQVSKDTPECVGTPSIEGASKTKVLGLAAEIVEQAKKEHESAGRTPVLKQENAKDK